MTGPLTCIDVKRPDGEYCKSLREVRKVVTTIGRAGDQAANGSSFINRDCGKSDITQRVRTRPELLCICDGLRTRSCSEEREDREFYEKTFIRKVSFDMTGLTLELEVIAPLEQHQGGLYRSRKLSQRLSIGCLNALFRFVLFFSWPKHYCSATSKLDEHGNPHRCSHTRFW